MRIFTTSRKKSQDFANYVSVFGLSMLVSSIIYCKKLETAWNYEQCDYIFEDENTLCADLCIWTACAGIGIGIGFLNLLLFFFVVCVLRNWSWCLNWNCGLDLDLNSNSPDVGYKLSFLENEKNENDINGKPLDKKYFDGNENETARNITKTSHINGTFSKCISSNFQTRIPIERINISPPTHLWFESICWILFILTPLTGTTFIVAALYKSDAYRTADENLYPPALALFLISILNLVIFCQKFLWNFCRKFYRKCRSLHEKYEYEYYSSKSSKNGCVTSHSHIQSV